jgi:chaperone modulatory protein CbpM
MTTEDLITADDFCRFHHIEYSFIGSLEDAGLIQLVILNEEKFIEKKQLQHLERIVRLSQDLEIDVAGIEVIIHLLSRMEQMQQEINDLKNRINFLSES